METHLIKSANRGKADYGWLQANYLFSFANYYNPKRMSFGSLRVFNDDIIHSNSGFSTHPHDNMEIVTIPMSGTLTHKDSMGHTQTLSHNEVQVMSAGTGIFHSEYNESSIKKANIFQLWITPNQHNIKPSYAQKDYDITLAQNQLQYLVHPNLSNTLSIQQDAYISRTLLTSDKELFYKVNNQSNGVLVFVVSGQIEIQNTHLSERDAIEIIQTLEFSIKSNTDSYCLIIEVPN